VPGLPEAVGANVVERLDLAEYQPDDKPCVRTCLSPDNEQRSG
jgi:hypothetical protein